MTRTRRDTEVEFKHPSYVVAAFSRRSGNPQLFGTKIPEHYGYVALTVSRATLRRDEHGDRYDGALGGDLVEIDFSAAQFAELITTMNVGVGTTGTLRRWENRSVPPPPELAGRVEHIAATFKSELEATAADVLGTDLLRAREILKQKTLTKTDRAEVAAMFERVARKLTDAAPFVVEMMNEAVVERVSAAKAEVDAAAASALTRIGLESLNHARPKEFGSRPPALSCGHERISTEQRYCHDCGKEHHDGNA
jgi:hypothetical protein